MKKLFLATLLLAGAAVCRAQGNLYDLSSYEGHGYPNGMSAYVVSNDEGDVILSIFEGNRMLQIINLGFVDINDYGDKTVKTVHFADVNYDGYPDILVGKEGPRCGIASAIYNPQTKKFEYEVSIISPVCSQAAPVCSQTVRFVSPLTLLHSTQTVTLSSVQLISMTSLTLMRNT